jgi:putative flippase GtrA
LQVKYFILKMNLTIKYTIVSIIATAADLSLFKLLELANWSYAAAATLLGMLLGTLITWILYRIWVFRDSTESEAHQRNNFLIGQAFSILFNVLMTALVTDYLGFARMPSRVFTSVLVWVLMYFFNRKVVFKV